MDWIESLGGLAMIIVAVGGHWLVKKKYSRFFKPRYLESKEATEAFMMFGIMFVFTGMIFLTGHVGGFRGLLMFGVGFFSAIPVTSICRNLQKTNPETPG